MSIDEVVSSAYKNATQSFAKAYRTGWQGIQTLKWGLIAGFIMWASVNIWAQTNENDPARLFVVLVATALGSCFVYLFLTFIFGPILGGLRLWYEQRERETIERPRKPSLNSTEEVLIQNRRPPRRKDVPYDLFGDDE